MVHWQILAIALLNATTAKLFFAPTVAKKPSQREIKESTPVLLVGVAPSDWSYSPLFLYNN